MPLPLGSTLRWFRRGLAPTGLATLATLALASSAGAVTSLPDHQCGVKVDGTVLCWGSNYYGELGMGAAYPQWSLAPVQVTGLSDAVSVSTTLGQSCAIRRTGSVVCWGSGWLGNGALNSPKTTPVPVTGLTDAIQVAAGATHSCAVRQTGAVVCWGTNTWGQLGDGRSEQPWYEPGPPPNYSSGVPVTVLGVSDAVAVSVGDLDSCAVRATGAVTCWGHMATTDSVYAPPASGATQVDLGTERLLCSVIDGTVACTGENNTGLVVEGVTGVREVRVTTDLMCVVKLDGTIWCAGDNWSGQLGDNTTNPSATLKQVPGITNAVELMVGWQMCARLADETVSCWGSDYDSNMSGPTLVPGLDVPAPPEPDPQPDPNPNPDPNSVSDLDPDPPAAPAPATEQPSATPAPAPTVAEQPKTTTTLAPVPTRPTVKSLRLVGRTVVFTRFAVACVRTGCPSRVKARVAVAGRHIRRTLKVTCTERSCVVMSARIKLPEAAARASKVSVKVSGERTRTQSVTLRRPTWSKLTIRGV